MRQRLVSATAALALQAGIVLLLLMSFPYVRQLAQEKETFFILPPPPRPVFKPAMIIDGRPRPPLRPSAAPPPLVYAPPVPVPPGAAPGNGDALLPDLGRRLADCTPQKYAEPSARAACPPPTPQAKKDDSDLLRTPRVKDEEYWAAEKANGDAPFALPGAAGGPLGILLTALFNPGAFADKHSYSYGPPVPPKGGAAPAAPGHEHASDVIFRQALEAANARKRSLYGKPAPAIATQAEGAP